MQKKGLFLANNSSANASVRAVSVDGNEPTIGYVYITTPQRVILINDVNRTGQSYTIDECVLIINEQLKAGDCIELNASIRVDYPTYNDIGGTCNLQYSIDGTNWINLDLLAQKAGGDNSVEIAYCSFSDFLLLYNDMSSIQFRIFVNDYNNNATNKIVKKQATSITAKILRRQ